MGAARAVLWLVAAVLAIRQATAVLRLPPGERLIDLETWIGENGVLHVKGSLYDTDRFTGTPFAGLVLKPLTRSAEQSLGVAWTFGTLLLVVGIGLVVARALPGPVSRRSGLLAAPIAISLLMLSLPVRNSFYLGQTSIIPVLLVLVGCFVARGERSSGVLIGIGAALQPTALLFAPLLWFTGRKQAAVTSAGTFAALSALSWAALPGDSWTYWVHHVAGAGLGARPDSLANQSLHGALLRFGLEGPLEITLYAALAAAVVWFGLRRAVRYARDGQLLLAVALTGCVAVAVSPTAWQHQLLWVLLAVVGRVGKRASDRMLWPVLVILVMTLPGKMLLPNMTALHPVRDNALLVAALAAAVAVPFLPRTSPYFRRPVPTEYVSPVPSRWSRIPLLPFWRRVSARPNLLLELLVIRVGYSVYSHIRTAATGSVGAAEEHGRQVVAIEQALHIDIELWANKAVAKAEWAESFFNFYYTSFHFVVPLSILAILYVRRPVDYRWARSSLAFATVLALLGFWLYPLAPPRLMPGMGFIDTVHGPQDLANPDYGAMTAVTNQYAAMPSLHFGWSLWCGLVVVLLAPKLWMKLLGLLHPLFTAGAIVATANHWILDAVGGAAVVGAGFGLTYLLSGRRKLLPSTATAGPAEAGPRLRKERAEEPAENTEESAVPAAPK
ncbi:bifunctional glycosyltransferase 87/phosphatase PAP2 family protein [Streptomyces sp. AM8-1-1]|uniref:bifunctional glycosyltransferase 87/phosphatase PAP2 family protein n=1 Tax=Streptomyces sp. AM8-1-1 TaxID=3075825 RepID=UPI0028C3D488|nr:bifunctional glycosyltransferase 87/phosphatase PAP2 family protein [Streptomyces sp. AM8-1-1]WNO74850.1 bifunctional glycosyltransferase 87/phosphatase PAP2 family protein [Streptomyces sp. AM8-1-1]